MILRLKQSMLGLKSNRQMLKLTKLDDIRSVKSEDGTIKKWKIYKKRGKMKEQR